MVLRSKGGWHDIDHIIHRVPLGLNHMGLAPYTQHTYSVDKSPLTVVLLGLLTYQQCHHEIEWWAPFCCLSFTGTINSHNLWELKPAPLLADIWELIEHAPLLVYIWELIEPAPLLACTWELLKLAPLLECIWELLKPRITVDVYMRTNRTCTNAGSYLWTTKTCTTADMYRRTNKIIEKSNTIILNSHRQLSVPWKYSQIG